MPFPCTTAPCSCSGWLVAVAVTVATVDTVTGSVPGYIHRACSAGAGDRGRLKASHNVVYMHDGIQGQTQHRTQYKQHASLNRNKT